MPSQIRPLVYRGMWFLSLLVFVFAANAQQPLAAGIWGYRDSQIPTNYSILDSLTQHSEIVGVGEATHGAHEFAAFRVKFFQYLVQQGKMHTFFLEADAGLCEAINDYVHGKTDPLVKPITSVRLWPFRIQELQELADWMRNYNAGNPSIPLEFRGADMQYLDDDAAILLRHGHLTRADSSFLKQISVYNVRFSMQNASLRDSVSTWIADYSNRLDSNTINPETHKIIKDALESMKQCIFKYNHPDLPNCRDSFMAINILNYKKQFPDRGIFFYAHNGHVGRIHGTHGNRAGYFLSQQYPAYYPIATECYAGDFWAMRKEYESGKFHIDKFKLQKHTKKHLAYFLHHYPYPFVMMEPKKHLSQLNLYQTMIGAVYAHDIPKRSTFYYMKEIKSFNLIFYVQDITPSEVIFTHAD